jgi:uncharacterized protein YjbI with pentapeptide repeats
MADQAHLDILQQGVEAWKEWREQNPSIRPALPTSNLSGADLSEADLSMADLSMADLSVTDLSGAYLYGAGLSGADLSGADLSGADLSESNLSGANLSWTGLSDANLIEAYLSGADLSMADLSMADLSGAKLIGANLSGADLSWANLSGAKLIGADLTEADLSGAYLYEATLTRANLRGANLREAYLSDADLSDAGLTSSALVKTNLTRTTLTGCSIYGISAWSLNLEGAKQQNLNVSDDEEPAIMVDNLEVAQFVYLLLNNEKIRDVIDTIGQKGVLILGRFTEQRKPVLDAIRDRLRKRGFVPILFDFARPTQQDFDETIKTLAGLSRFVIADITNPQSSPLELQATMPDYMIPFVPIIHEDEEPFAMFQGLQHKYGEWVLDVLEYDSASNLLEVLDEAVVRPALVKADQLILKKAEAIRKRHVKDYLPQEGT